MALRDPYMVKTVEGNTDLTLEATTGESFLVKDIMVVNPSSNWATITVEKATVAYFRVGGNGGNHLQFTPQDDQVVSLMNDLYDKGLHRGIPVAEGQTLTISGVSQSTSFQVIVYEEYDAGDQTPDDPNGSEADSYDYINYGSCSTNPGDGDTEYDTTDTTAEFPDFPFEGDVPSGKTLELLAIAASDNSMTDSSASNKQITKYLKLIEERTVLFDDSRNGIPIIGVANTGDSSRHPGEGYAEIGAYSSEDKRPIFVVPGELVFTSGQELTVYLTTEVTAGTRQLSSGDCPVAFIQRVESA